MDILAPIYYLRRRVDTSLRKDRYALRIQAQSALELSNNAFTKNFRLTKETFLYVLGEVEQDFPVPRRSSFLSVETILLTCLKFLAEGSYQQGIGKDFHVNLAQPTVSKVVKEMLASMEKRLGSKWIRFPVSEEEKREARNYFFDKSGIPGITMCLDGTHIKILRPGDRPHSFFNRKQFYSINTLIICDHKCRIRFVDARYPGSCHDSHIWYLSAAKAYVENCYRHSDRSIRLLGDFGYPLQPWLLTPCRNAEEGSRESRYNRNHSSARNIVERTIGYLKNRFRCLMDERALYYDKQKSAQIINVCCALHNICLHYDRNFFNNFNEEHITVTSEINTSMSPDSDMDEGISLRNQILELF